MTSRFSPVLWLLIVVAVLAAACGGSTNTGGSNTSSPAASSGTGSTGAQSSPTGAAASAGGQSSSGGQSSLAAIKQRGKLRVGVKYDAPPFGVLDPKTNQVKGFDIDVSRGIAKAILGDENKVDFVQVTSKNRIPLLQKGDIDFFAATATITNDRLKEINFSDVYYQAGQSLLVKKDSPIKTYQDLKGKTVCTVSGSTPEQTIRALVPGVNVQLFETYPDCLQSLKDGRVDAITTDNVLLEGMRLQDPQNLKLTGGLFTAEPYGIGIAKGNDELTKAVNDALKGMKGQYSDLFKKWLNQPLPKDFDQWFLMDAKTAAQKFAEQQAKFKKK